MGMVGGSVRMVCVCAGRATDRRGDWMMMVVCWDSRRFNRDRGPKSGPTTGSMHSREVCVVQAPRQSIDRSGPPLRKEMQVGSDTSSEAGCASPFPTQKTHGVGPCRSPGADAEKPTNHLIKRKGSTKPMRISSWVGYCFDGGLVRGGPFFGWLKLFTRHMHYPKKQQTGSCPPF